MKEKKETAVTIMKAIIKIKVSEVKAMGKSFHDFANWCKGQGVYYGTSEGQNQIQNAFYGKISSVSTLELLNEYIKLELKV